MLENAPFVKMHLEEDKDYKPQDTFTVKLNKEERKVLDECKEIMEQEKDSTAIKQLAWIAAKVLHEEKISYILGTVFENKRKNKRLGIVEFEG